MFLFIVHWFSGSTTIYFSFLSSTFVSLLFIPQHLHRQHSTKPLVRLFPAFCNVVYVPAFSILVVLIFVPFDLQQSIKEQHIVLQGFIHFPPHSFRFLLQGVHISYILLQGLIQFPPHLWICSQQG